MIKAIQQTAASDPAAAAKPAPASSIATPTPANTDQGATRLYVERNGEGTFVYRIVDTVTGRTLAEVPREQADQLKASPDYAAGAIVSTSA